ncbi:universal stress protein [Mycobacterium servetii]|uniref:Universal stress protein n=1 Tax=Mycobacterium servetii TaxID=3237418 RepID=A0ABV4C682_9MYCO
MSAQQFGIVVGVDGSPSSTVAVEWAARDAEIRDVPLHLVHVVAPAVTPIEPWVDPSSPSSFPRHQEQQARRIVEEARGVAVAATSSDRASQITGEVLYAPVVSALVDLSGRAEMIVVGCRGQGAVTHFLLGSVSSGLVHHAHCPVGVIHDEEPHTSPPSRAPVVVGIHGSPASELATAIAFDEASRRSVGLVALHAWNDMGPLDFASMNWAPIEWRNIEVREEEALAERLCGWRERYPDVDVHQVVVCDRPTPRLLEQASTAQLVVVGSHDHTALPGMLLGSVSRTVVNAAQIPVIVARTPRPGAHTTESR